MSNDALRHQLTEVLALASEQMADIAAVQRKQAELTASGTVADGMVEVTVNAAGHLISTVIDESYLDEYDFEELSGHITEAAQTAARAAAARVADLMAPLTDRRTHFPSLADVIDGAPDIRDLLPRALEPFAENRPNKPRHDNDSAADTAFPTVRR
ncbi:YbaB/EbfC family nucleoid-associated protein [Mycobacterium neglectum]|uniref:YbaB/EbfC family nucleoid-associated protein n=1 Tax=Mycobacterium neglectum TaxID=242737 RepID=UPI000BFEE470|nr:YbaB/EbfC family nucleoid-associated protein [Mycobacterium neglectum]